jgi:hypothetical protein
MSNPNETSFSTTPWQRDVLLIKEGVVTCTRKLNFIPLSKVGLNHKNPGKWSDYEKIDPESREFFARFMTPNAYLRMHYNKSLLHDLFCCLKTHWKLLKCTEMLAGGSLQEVGSMHERRSICATAHDRVKTISSKQIENTYKGEHGRIDNLYGLSFLTVTDLECRDGVKVLQGFKPYITWHTLDEDGNKERFYLLYNKTENSLEVLKCRSGDHSAVMLHIGTHSTLKKLEKMCAYCGSTRGEGKKERLLKCKCKTCRYCTKDCQKMHWLEHRHLCKAMDDIETVSGVEKQDCAKEDTGESADVFAEDYAEEDTKVEIDVFAEYYAEDDWLAEGAALVAATKASEAKMEAMLASFESFLGTMR